MLDIKKIQFSINDRNKIFITGVKSVDIEIEALYNEQPIKTIITNKKFNEFVACVALDENWEKIDGKLLVKFINKESVVHKEEITRDILLAMYKNNKSCIDDVLYESKTGEIVVRGWVATENKSSILFLDENKKPLDTFVRRIYRQELYNFFNGEKIEALPGFEIKVEKASNPKFVEIKIENEKTILYPINSNKATKIESDFRRKLSKAKNIYKTQGIKAVIKKILKKNKMEEFSQYENWLKNHLPSEKELEIQRKIDFDYRPKFSIVIPLYKTNKLFLEQLIDSIKNQSYNNWEICFSDGSGKASPLTEFLEKANKEDNRIKYISSEASLGISENTNNALKIVNGDWIVFADHDDLLTPNSLFELTKCINENPNAEFIYSDEDKVSTDGSEFFGPYFKPDFNIDLLRSQNYMCHIVCVKRELQREVGELDPNMNGAQDYDFNLRCVEKAKEVCHIPKVIYHWRCHKDSTAENPESKLYAFEAGKRAVKAHYERVGIKAEVNDTKLYGLYRSKYILENKPLVSIIIPNKDHIEDLNTCIKSILNKSTYDNYEIIIVENNSMEISTFEYYRELEKDKRIRILYWDDEFNYSAINNFGVENAKGDYVLFLNNDTEVISENWIEEMLGFCMREDVAIVGARLLYPDRSIQHCGVILGVIGAAFHQFITVPEENPGYYGRILCAHDLNAVTAACMLMKKAVFEEVGGFDEKLRVAYNDVDLCIKARDKGYLVVYSPYAMLYHYESKSRGLDITKEKQERHDREATLLINKWPQFYEKIDRYYSPNL